MAGGSRQHYIPAAVIGGFSENETKPGRERTVFVRTVDQGGVRLLRAENVGWSADLYTLESPDELPASLIDDSWEYVENHLPEAISYLAEETGDIRADIWFRVFVPYVAQLFARQVDFESNFNARFGDNAELVAQITPKDNARFARIMELQRMYFPVMDAHWTVVHNGTSIPIIINDCGYGVFNNGPGQSGYAIPLSKNVAVSLIIGPAPNSMYQDERGKYIRGPQHAVMDDNSVRTLNGMLFGTALREVYGATESVVEDAAAVGMGTGERMTSVPRSGQLLVHSPQWARQNEGIYQAMLSHLD
jgi:Protein of unknown function (DUF4238)